MQGLRDQQCYGKIFGRLVVITRCGNYFGGYDFNFSSFIPKQSERLCCVKLQRSGPTVGLSAIFCT